MSDYISFGGNYYQSSQTRKISIGIMADSQPKRNPAPDKVDGDVIARVEKLKSATVINLQTIKKEKVDVAAKQKNPVQGTEHVTSPWRSPKSTYRKLGTLENVLSKQTSSLSGSKGLNSGLNKAHQAPAFDSFQNFPQHCNGGKNEKGMQKTQERIEKEPEKVASQREKMDKPEKVASQREKMDKPEKVASQREKIDTPEKDKNGSTDALRSKLWEILGKPSPANNQDEVMNSETPETQDVVKKKTNFKLSQEKGSNDDPVLKPRHYSDTIETDSESPGNATKRPVTRSLLPRKVGAKSAQKKTKAGANLARRCTEQVNNIFSFEEGLQGKNGTTAAVNSSVMPKKQRGRKKNIVVQCRKVHSLEKETSKSKTPPSFESSGTGKRSSSSDRKESSHELYPQSKARKQKPNANTREEEFHQSPEAETAATKPGMFHGLSKKRDKQEKPSTVFKEKSVEPENDFQSPTFGYKAPISSPSPCLSPEASPLHPRNINPSFDETETPPIFSFGTKKTSEGTKGQASETEKRLPDFLEKKADYSFGRESSAEPDEDLVLSDPSSDEKESDESGEEDSPALRHFNSPKEKETADRNNKKSKLGSSSTKRNSKRVVLSPPSSLSKGIQEKPDAFQKFSEIDEEDEDEDEGLGRAIGLFALALQNYEKKLKSAAEKKSSEIIASVSDEIQQELENVKSYILTDAGKTSNLAKTKRKHAETKLQEQQEKMRMIHEKFKDDVGNHLEDFKNTIEGLEETHSELKGSIKKQKTSHQKLIAQFEGGIETKLDNATKRIDSVNKCAKGKMLQLKMIVAECLKDDML